MVHVTEMRVPMPMTVEEFKRGQRYANWKTNESNTSEGEGGQLVSSAPYVNEIWGEGSFTHSLYRLGDRLPDWVTKLVPASALVIDEKTWMAYPHIRSILTVPFFNKLKIEMITVHENDDGSAENILGLSEAELAIRKVDMVDIALDKVQKRDYRADLDPQLVSSKKTGRGPLLSGWQKTSAPMMCAYKLVRVEANYWGVQSRIEKLMLNGVRQIILLTHRNAFCYIDQWLDLTFEEIRAWELEGRQRMKATVKQPPIIDPDTGLEFVVDSSGEISKGTESVNSEDSDVDLEFFEATMEWTTQESEEFGDSLMSGVSTPFNWKLPGASESCAVCEARSKTSTAAQVVCETCKEFFCHKCFSEFHVTPRQKDHVRQYKTASTNEPTRKNLSGEGSGTIVQERRNDQEVSSSCPTVLSSPVTAERATSKSTSGGPQQVHLTKGVENKLAHQRDPSWLEELNSSTEGTTQSSPAPPLSRRKSSSNYKVLNSLSNSNLDNGQESTPVSSSNLGGPQTSSRKKSTVRPNELSEEMVRSISLLYQIRAGNLFPPSPPHNSGQFLPQMRSRSRPRSSSLDLGGSEQQLENLIGETVLDPYGVQELVDSGVHAKCVSVTAIPEMDAIKDSELCKHVRALVELLQNVDPHDMTHEQRLAFWINLYNSLMMHAYIVRGTPRSHYKRIALMHKSAYIVGGHLISALAIEHAILRACSYRPALASLLPVHKYKKHDSRQAYALDRPEPRVSFALCCGSHSSPMVRVYTAGGIHTELEEACKDFLTASVGFTRHSRVMIPKIMHWYARDFSSDARSLLEWIALQLPDDRRATVEECLEKKRGKKTSQQLSVVSYDWSFRYLFKRIADP